MVREQVRLGPRHALLPLFTGRSTTWIASGKMSAVHGPADLIRPALGAWGRMRELGRAGRARRVLRLVREPGACRIALESDSCSWKTAFVVSAEGVARVLGLVQESQV